MTQTETSLREIQIEGLAYRRIVDLAIAEEAGRHGSCRLVAETAQPMKQAELLALGQKKIVLKTPAKDIIFCGMPQKVTQAEDSGMRRLYLELGTLSMQLDRTPRSRTFQDPNKTLKQVLAQVVKECGVSGAEISGGKQESEKIEPMLYQDRQTDWAFLSRLAAGRGAFVFADAKTNKLKIGVGAIPFTGKSASGVMRERGRRVLLGLAESIKQNTDDKAVKTSFVETELITDCLWVGVGYELNYGGQKQVVKKSQIVTEGSTLVNYLTVIPLAGCRVSVAAELDGLYTGKYLVGKVLEAQGTGKETDCIKVHFDCDKSQDKNKARWIPYMNVINNYMYAMPDEGDRVSVYFEESGKLFALGSLRDKGAQQRIASLKPEDRSFCSQDQLMEFKPKEVSLVAGQKANNVWLKGTDSDGISLRAKADVLMNSDGDLILESADGMVMSKQLQLLGTHMAGYTPYLATTGQPSTTQFNPAGAMLGKSLSSLKSEGKGEDKVTPSEFAKELDKKTGAKSEQKNKNNNSGGGSGGKLTVKAGKTLLLAAGDSSIEVSSGKIKTRVLFTGAYIPGGGLGDGSPAAIGPAKVNNRSDSIKKEHGAKDRKRIQEGGGRTGDNKRISRAG